MPKNEKLNLLLNRAVAFIVGGLLVLLVMNFTVVKKVKAENEQLTSALDTSRYEAGRLLEDAKAQLANGDYAMAEASLASLFTNQPGSAEATEGKVLLAQVEKESMAADERWEAALPSIRKEWTDTLAAELRGQIEKDRAKFENELEATINAAWAKAESKVREEWSAEQ